VERERETGERLVEWRGRERGTTREEDNALREEEEALRTRGRRRSSSKAKGKNRGHERGEEFLCPKRRDTNVVVSGNHVCM